MIKKCVIQISTNFSWRACHVCDKSRTWFIFLFHAKKSPIFPEINENVFLLNDVFFCSQWITLLNGACVNNFSKCGGMHTHTRRAEISTQGQRRENDCFADRLAPAWRLINLLYNSGFSVRSHSVIYVHPLGYTRVTEKQPQSVLDTFYNCDPRWTICL